MGIRLFFCATLILTAFLLIADQVFAQERAVFFLSPQSGNFRQGDSFSVELRFNSSELVTSIKSELVFDPSVVRVESVDSQNSIFTYWWENFFDNKIGIIRLQASVPSPGLQEGFVAKINLYALKSGQVNIVFKQSSLALKPNDENIFNFTASAGASFSIFSPIFKQLTGEHKNILAVIAAVVIFISAGLVFKKKLTKKNS